MSWWCWTYEAGGNAGVHERHILKALANQDLAEPFDVLLVENAKVRDSVPDDLREICPRLDVIFGDEQPAALKNFGARHARTECIAVLEADCVQNQV